MHMQLKITQNECRLKSAHLAAANTFVSCSFFPSFLPGLSLTREQVSSCTPALERWSNPFSVKPAGNWSLVLTYLWEANALQMLPFQTSAVSGGANKVGHGMAAPPELQRSRSPQIWEREETALHQPKPNITVSNVSTGSRKTLPAVKPFLYSLHLLLDSLTLNSWGLHSITAEGR